MRLLAAALACFSLSAQDLPWQASIGVGAGPDKATAWNIVYTGTSKVGFYVGGSLAKRERLGEEGYFDHVKYIFEDWDKEQSAWVGAAIRITPYVTIGAGYGQTKRDLYSYGVSYVTGWTWNQTRAGENKSGAQAMLEVGFDRGLAFQVHAGSAAKAFVIAYRF